MAEVIALSVNGVEHKVAAEPDRNLLGVLRDELDLTGSKYGCGEGRCGACTVVIDGRAVRSCHTSLSECSGKPITTIEGLARDGKLHPLQDAFLHAGAMQCGYCTPGMIMNAYALLGKIAAPDERADRPRNGRERLPLWHVRPHRSGHPPGRRGDKIESQEQAAHRGQTRRTRAGDRDEGGCAVSHNPSLNDDAQVLIEPERYELFEGPRYEFELARRDFFKVLGAGIVVCFVVSRADAYQEESGGRRRRGGGRRSGRGGGAACRRKSARGCISTRRAK